MERNCRVPNLKEFWWWNEEVQFKIRNKKICYKAVYQCSSEENLKNYKETKKVAKRVVSEVRSKAYENLYKRLDTKDGERDIYKLAKARERKTRDLNQVKCIKDENQNVLVNEGAIKERWKEYFAKLFNDGGDTRVGWDILVTPKRT